MTIALPPLRSIAAERTGDPVGSQPSFYQCIRPRREREPASGTFPSLKNRTHLWEIGRKPGLQIRFSHPRKGSPRGSGWLCFLTLAGSTGLPRLQPSVPQAQHPVAAGGKLKIVGYQQAGHGIRALPLPA